MCNRSCYICGCSITLSLDTERSIETEKISIGGVDSSVVAALLIKAIGKQLVCVRVNHGLLRKGEPEQVVQVLRDEMDANLVYVLKKITDRITKEVENVNRVLYDLTPKPSGTIEWE